MGEIYLFGAAITLALLLYAADNLQKLPPVTRDLIGEHIGADTPTLLAKTIVLALGWPLALAIVLIGVWASRRG